MEQHTHYMVYLFREKATGTVIYVGSCKNFGARMNDHRRSLRDKGKRLAPIHQYMLDNNLRLFDDVEVAVVWYGVDVTKEQALEKEAEYFYKYQDTVKNTRPAEIRDGEFGANRKAVRCVTDGKVYATMKMAAEAYGLHYVTISNHINKGYKLKCGLIFEYADQPNNPDRQLYTVRCVEDNRYFQMLSHCAKAYGMDRVFFTNKFGRKHSIVLNGKTFERCNDHSERKYAQVGGNGEALS